MKQWGFFAIYKEFTENYKKSKHMLTDIKEKQIINIKA